MSAVRKKSDLKKIRAEVSALKTENARLKKQSQTKSRNTRKRTAGVFKKVAVIFLLAVAVVLLIAANLLFWSGNTVVKQDRFVAATEPIIKDPIVQQTMALYTTNKIFDNVDVQQKIESVLPPRADFLAPQLTTQLRGGTEKVFQNVLAKPSFQEKWNQVQARQHERLINFSTKYEGDDKISINEVYTQLSSNLKDTKLAFLADKSLPPKIGEVTVINATWLPVFHNVVTNIDTWRLLAVILLVASIAGAVMLSRHRRRTIYTFSLISASAMAATLVALHVVSNTIVNKAEDQYAEGVRRVLQIVFHSLVIQTITIMAGVVLVGLIAWISGPSRQAVKLRGLVQELFSGKLHSRLFATENKYTLWIRNNKRLIEWLIIGIIAAIMLLTRLTLLGLLLYGLLMLVLILIVELIGGQEVRVARAKK